MVERSRSIALFEQVRDLPYATDAAFDAAGLESQGRGNCVAKAELLAHLLAGAGESVHLVSWEYELPMMVPVQFEEAFTLTRDVHTAVMVRRGEGRILVDATHDPPLASLGLPVASWDGTSGTVPAHTPIGPVIVRDHPGSREALDSLIRGVSDVDPPTSLEKCVQYQQELNALFDEVRF